MGNRKVSLPDVVEFIISAQRETNRYDERYAITAVWAFCK